MSTAATELWIKMSEFLQQGDCELVRDLQERCSGEDHVTLKLELDYRRSDAEQRANTIDIHAINEFLCFRGAQLVAYVGISAFGGESEPFEITGMVHPDYRRHGIFTRLLGLAREECRRRKPNGILLLCDRESAAGHALMERVGAAYGFSEYEMYLNGGSAEGGARRLCDVGLRKATNEDAREVARQDAMYWGHDPQETDEGIPLPEDEEKRGMTIYLAQVDSRIVGKVNLQLVNGLGGIYGLGVLPEHRGKGLGRAILVEAIEKLQAAGAARIMLQVEAGNATALNLYTSCGFRATSVMDYWAVE